MGLIFYKRYPGDYMRSTAHLSLSQHGVYTLLLDHYYSTGKPIPLKGSERICRAFDNDEREDVEFILSQFFTRSEEGYTHSRCDKELAKAEDIAEQARLNGRKGGRPKNKRITQPVSGKEPSRLADDNQWQTQPVSGKEPSGKASQKPETIVQSQKSETTKKTLSDKSDNVGIVFSHWQQVMNHPRSKLDDKRKKDISKALKMGYTIDQCKQAITGCSKTPHNIGDNQQKQRYDGLHIIFRSADQIDRFIGNSGRKTRDDDMADWINEGQESVIDGEVINE